MCSSDLHVLPRRRPQQVAKEAATLDHLSGGRLTLVATIGSMNLEYEGFGQSADLRARGAALDAGLDQICALWAGSAPVGMTPAPVQRPRIPIWCGGRWPNRAPFRRAARWDGVMPIHAGYGLGETMPPGELRAVLRYTHKHRTAEGPFDVALEGQTDGTAGDRGGRLVASYAHAGLTWWIEALGWWRGSPADAMSRIRQGPPVVG